MHEDGFSRCHPAVNFLFFLGAIGFGVVIQHPAYAAAGCIGSAIYYLLLKGKQALPLLGGCVTIFSLISFLNPLINHQGKHVLFLVFGKAYTREALYYGMALGALFVIMLLWFGCYSIVLTSDKFTALFGRVIPSLSLLLVMILRLIPAFTRKADQIQSARRTIGKGVLQSDRFRDRLRSGIAVLSSLTDWALEGSIITADSMRCRGYGSGKRTNFRLYTMTARDFALLALILSMELAVIIAGGTHASFTPRLRIDSVTWGFPIYCAFLLIPTLLHIKEAIAWQISISRI